MGKKTTAKALIAAQEDRAKQEFNETRERFAPICKRINEILLEKDVPYGYPIQTENFTENHLEAALEIQKLLKDSDIKFNEIDRVFQFALTPFDQVKTMAVEGFKRTMQNTMAKLFDRDIWTDVTLEDIDRTIKLLQEAKEAKKDESSG